MVCSIEVVYSKKNFLSALRKAKRENCTPSFFDFGDIPSALKEIARAYHCQPISPYVWDDEERDIFLRAYRDLIGELNIYFHSRNKPAWQMTDIASKNRFTSRIPYVLEWSLQMQKFLEKAPQEFIIIIAPPWTIVPELRKYIIQRGFFFSCQEFLFVKWTDIIQKRLEWYRDLFVDIVKVIRDIWYSRRLQPRLLSLRAQKNKTWYVIKTFIYNHSFFEDGTYRDIFFGPLPAYLEKEGRHTIILGRILGDHRTCTQKMKATEQNIFPLESFLSIASLLLSVSQLLSLTLKINKRLLFFNLDVTNIMRNELLRTRNGVVLSTSLHYYAVKNFVSHFSVEAFLMTYEGNPWERMCIRALREHASPICIFGYQHTVVHHSAVNMFLSAREFDILPLPDRIFTVGEEAKHIIEKYSEYPNNYIVPTCGLRFEYLYAKDIFTPPLKQFRFRLLAALEGTLETLSFLKFLFHEANHLPEYTIRVRPHPALSFQTLNVYASSLMKNIPTNVTFSSSNLENDLEWCDVVIYAASTMALEALMLERPVVHVRKESILDSNPLFRLRDCVWIVSEKEHLDDTLRAIREISAQELSQRRRAARAYLASYLSPITEECLSRFLPNAALTIKK